MSAGPFGITHAYERFQSLDGNFVRFLSFVVVLAWPFASASGRDAQEYFEASRWSLVAPHDGALVAANPRLSERLGLSAWQRERIEKVYRQYLEDRAKNSSALRHARIVPEQYPANGASREEVRRAKELADKVRDQGLLIEKQVHRDVKAILNVEQEQILEKLVTPTLIVHPLDLRANDASQLCIDDSGRTLAALRPDVATVFDLSSENPPRDYAIPPGEDPTISSKPSNFKLSGDGRNLLLGIEPRRRGQHKIMATFRIEDQKLLHHYVWTTGPSAYWSSLTISRDLRRIAGSASHDGDAIRIWDTSDGRELHSLPGVRARSVLFSPDLKQIAIGNDCEVSVRDATTGVALFTRPVTRYQEMLAFSRDGGRLAVGSSNAIEVIDSRTGAPLVSFRIPGTGIWGCTFVNQDRWLMCHSDKAVSLWDAARGEELGIVLRQTHWYATAVAASETSAIVMLANGRLFRLSVNDTLRSTVP